MPVTHCFDHSVLVIACEGEYAPDELRSTWDQAIEDPAFTEGTDVCLDVRESVSLANRSTKDLREITNWFSRESGIVNHRCALLTKPGIQFGLMRMASIWIDFRGTEAKVFTDRDEAHAWLADQRQPKKQSENGE